MGKFSHLLRKGKKKKTVEQARESLRAAGILTESGELAAKYRGTSRSKKPTAKES